MIHEGPYVTALTTMLHIKLNDGVDMMKGGVYSLSAKDFISVMHHSRHSCSSVI